MLSSIEFNALNTSSSALRNVPAFRCQDTLGRKALAYSSVTSVFIAWADHALGFGVITVIGSGPSTTPLNSLVPDVSRDGRSSSFSTRDDFTLLSPDSPLGIVAFTAHCVPSVADLIAFAPYLIPVSVPSTSRALPISFKYCCCSGDCCEYQSQTVLTVPAMFCFILVGIIFAVSSVACPITHATGEVTVDAKPLTASVRPEAICFGSFIARETPDPIFSAHDIKASPVFCATHPNVLPIPSRLDTTAPPSFSAIDCFFDSSCIVCACGAFCVAVIALYSFIFCIACSRERPLLIAASNNGLSSGLIS